MPSDTFSNQAPICHAYLGLTRVTVSSLAYIVYIPRTLNNLGIDFLGGTVSAIVLETLHLHRDYRPIGPVL